MDFAAGAYLSEAPSPPSFLFVSNSLMPAFKNASKKVKSKKPRKYAKLA
jgi:hypothetical protein